MRRTLLVALAVALISGMAVSTFAASGVTSITWPISIQFGQYDIDLRSGSLDPLTYGIVGPNADVLSNTTGGQNRITLSNLGYATINYTASVVCSNPNTWTTTSPWIMAAAVDGNTVNTAVLAGIFTAPVIASEQAAPYGRDLAISNFGDEDVLGSAAIEASLTRLFWQGGTDPDWMSGYNVSTFPTGSTERSIRFLMQAPSDLEATYSTSVIFNVTIGAVVF